MLDYLHDSLFLEHNNRLKLNQQLVSLDKNPLTIINGARGSMDGETFGSLIVRVIPATVIYSYISVANRTDYPIEHAQLFINDVISSGDLSVVGWTALSGITELNSNGPNIRLTLGSIQPKQSVEVLLKGQRIIRANDVSIVLAPLSNIDKGKVLLYMGILLLVVCVISVPNWVSQGNKS